MRSGNARSVYGGTCCLPGMLLLGGETVLSNRLGKVRV